MSSNDYIQEKELYDAAKCGSLEIVEKQLSLSQSIVVDANWANSESWPEDTSLIVASKNGFIPIVSLLLQHDADVNKANKDGETPL